MDVVVTGGDVTRGKPLREAYLRAAEPLEVDITRGIVLGDKPPGVAAGVAAAARVVAVPCTSTFLPREPRDVAHARRKDVSSLAMGRVGAAPALPAVITGAALGRGLVAGWVAAGLVLATALAHLLLLHASSLAFLAVVAMAVACPACAWHLLWSPTGGIWAATAFVRKGQHCGIHRGPVAGGDHHQWATPLLMPCRGSGSRWWPRSCWWSGHWPSAQVVPARRDQAAQPRRRLRAR